MAGYTVISDISEQLIRLLRDNLVPEVIPSPDGIGLSSPADKGDFSLGLYLYDIRENEEIILNGMQTAGQNEQRFPSKYINLYYMVTAYSVSDLKFRAAEEQRILGRAMQVLMDHSILNLSGTGRAGGDRYPARIEFLQLDSDEKIKLWNMSNQPYKMSLFYQVSPVELESTKTKKVSRVRQVEVELVETQQNGKG